jgi:uncharacterized membrane protein
VDAEADAQPPEGQPPEGPPPEAPPPPPDVPAPPVLAPPPFPWARLALPLAKLAGVGYSVGLFVQLLALRDAKRIPFLLSNTLGKAPRMRLLISLGLAVVLPSLVALAVVLRRWRRSRGWDDTGVLTLERVASLLAPLALLFAFVPLTSLDFAWGGKQFAYVVILAVVGLSLEVLMRGSFEAGIALGIPARVAARTARLRAWLPARLPFLIVLVAALAYGAVNSYYTILNHRRLGTMAFDLGIYDNLMFNALHGRFFRSPVLFGPAGGNYLAGHAEFVMLLFLPLYAIRPGAETMLIIQSFFFGLAAVPLYMFARTLLRAAPAAVVAVLYLFFAPLHGPNFYDFHWLPIAMFFHFWLYYAIARNKPKLTALMVLVLFSVREDVAVGIAVLGVFLLFTQLRPRLGFILMVSSITWFVIDRFVIMQLAGNWFFQNFYNDLFADGESTYASVVKTLISNPLYLIPTLLTETKLQYTLHMLAPLLLLPVRRLSTALFVLPGFFFTLMTTNYAPVLSLAFQYTSHWIPYMFLGTVLGLVLLERRRGAVASNAAVAAMAVVLVAHSYCFGGLLQHEKFTGGFSQIQFHMTPAEKQRYADLRALIAMIPREASVAATEREAAHVSTRLTMYPLRSAPGPVDYVLLGRQNLSSAISFVSGLFTALPYQLVAKKGDELYLFKRGPSNAETEAAKAALGIYKTQ